MRSKSPRCLSRSVCSGTRPAWLRVWTRLGAVLVGPVVAAAVILDDLRPIAGLADSKKLTEARREKLFDEIRAKALCCSIAEASVEEIDQLNILQATMLAMRRAVQGLRLKPVMVLVDGNRIPTLDIPAEAIVKGDALVQSISAASILAKVHRDRWCRQVHEQYPQYGFAGHKGMAPRPTWRRCRPMGLRSITVARLRRWPGTGFGRRKNACMTSSAVTLIQSRDNALVKDLRRLAQDTTAYRKQGRVWLEGDHLCRAAWAFVRPAMAVFSESYWPQWQHEKALAAIKIVVMPDALFKGHQRAGIAGGHGLSLGSARCAAAGRDGRHGRAGSGAGRGQCGLHLAQRLCVWLSAGAGRQRQCGPVVAQGVARRHGGHFALNLVEGVSEEDLAVLQVPLVVTSSTAAATCTRPICPGPVPGSWGTKGRAWPRRWKPAHPCASASRNLAVKSL